MAKISKEELQRLGGAEWMLRQIKEKGIEEAEKDLRWRTSMGVPLSMTASDFKSLAHRLGDNCLKAVLALSCLCLHDMHGFGHKRLKRYIEKMNIQSECILDDYTSWENTLQILRDECKINLDLTKDIRATEADAKKNNGGRKV